MIFDLKPPVSANTFLEQLKAKGVLAVPFGPQTVRFVTHLDVTEAMIDRTIEILHTF